jgi:hypothetical protein
MQEVTYKLYCDSPDLYYHLLKHEKMNARRDGDNRRKIDFFDENRKYTIEFVFKHAQIEQYLEACEDVLSKTCGTPDYILKKSNGDTELCIEDSHTAPVGNAVLQRLDKLLPLMLNEQETYPVMFIGPKQGLDKSNLQIRSWTQSWFYRCFVKNREDLFLLLEDGENLYDKVIKEIISQIKKPKEKRIISKLEIQSIIDSMNKNIRSINDGVFEGKMFKPNGTDAHPVQSTVFCLSELKAKIENGTVVMKCSEQHKKKILDSKSKRVAKIVENGVVFK